MKTMKNEMKRMADWRGLVGLGLLLWVGGAEAAIPQGNFVAQDRQAQYELILRTQGDQTLGVLFYSPGRDSGEGYLYGNLFQVEESGDGSLAFVRQFSDGHLPSLRTHSEVGYNATYTAREFAGRGMVEELHFSISTPTGRLVFRRPNPHARLEWVENDFTRPFQGRSHGAIQGTWIGDRDADSRRVTYSITGLQCSAIPSDGRVELNPSFNGFEGLYSLRGSEANLNREGGQTLQNGLVGVAITLRSPSNVGYYRETRVIFFNPDVSATIDASGRILTGNSCSGFQSYGNPVVSFKERRI
jgi:hypothetical protein